MENKDFYDRILIKLKRQYSKDEVLSAIIKKLSEAEIEIGKLNSEIDYLQNKMQAKQEQKEINRLAKIEARKEELYLMKVEENKKQRKKIKELTNVRDSLICKCAHCKQKQDSDCDKTPPESVRLNGEEYYSNYLS